MSTVVDDYDLFVLTTWTHHYGNEITKKIIVKNVYKNKFITNHTNTNAKLKHYILQQMLKYFTKNN